MPGAAQLGVCHMLCQVVLACLLILAACDSTAEGPVQHTCSVAAFGAAADGQTYDTQAIQKAIDACAKQIGTEDVGIVTLEEGRQYLSGTVKLATRVRLRIPEGTTLLAGDQRKAYGADDSTWYLILADGCTSCGIEGEGTIDGQSDEWVIQSASSPEKELRSFCPAPQQCLPRLIGIRNSRQVSIDSVRIVNFVHGAVYVVNSDAVAIMGSTISSDMQLVHSGGIEVDGSKRMYVGSVDISTGGDAFHIHTTADSPCESILLENAALQSASAAIHIGDASNALIETLLFRNLLIRESRAGVAVQLRDAGAMRDLQFSNITIATRLFADVDEQATDPVGPVSVTASPRTADGVVGRMSNITFQNLSITAESGIVVAGTHRSSIDALIMDTLTLELAQLTDYRGGRVQPAANDQPVSLEMVPAIYLENVNHASIQQAKVVFGDPARPEWGSSLELAPRTVHALSVQGLMVHDESAHPWEPEETAEEEAARTSSLMDWARSVKLQHQPSGMSLQENAAPGVQGRKAASSASLLIIGLTACVVLLVLVANYLEWLPCRRYRTKRRYKQHAKLVKLAQIPLGDA